MPDDTRAGQATRRRTPAERIAAIKAREAQLKAQRQVIEARVSEQQRKERTHLLCELGGMALAWGITQPEQINTIMEALTRTPEGRALLTSAGATMTWRWPPAEGPNTTVR